MSSITLIWFAVGTAFIVAELATGTFYLLIFGVAAWAGAFTAYAHHSLATQLAVAGVAAVVGFAIVVPYDVRRRRAQVQGDDDLDIGNDVRVAEVVDPQRLKVNYRGSEWEAAMETGDTGGIAVGARCVIAAVRGNRLIVRRAHE